ncbi:hypothetical protein [Candidatus Methylomicrobium oryzae]|uniref:hypothetical protein n=1 Tax=Candidatus Methylomicrobium oryzae TaxID=2802053 RepID=UPI0019220A95|nr:hypothetical protein [Methylomicrobium sp. RS1]MBL1263876.1 hypothetical protein [Methylomicrobium sp. RS1]
MKPKKKKSRREARAQRSGGKIFFGKKNFFFTFPMFPMFPALPLGDRALTAGAAHSLFGGPERAQRIPIAQFCPVKYLFLKKNFDFTFPMFPMFPMFPLSPFGRPRGSKAAPDREAFIQEIFFSGKKTSKARSRCSQRSTLLFNNNDQ